MPNDPTKRAGRAAPQRKAAHPPAPPAQKPVTDEEETQPREPSLLSRVLKRAALGVLLVLALVFAYIFLLLGEPDDEAKNTPKSVEETITMPMNALDVPGESDVQKLADSFGQPVLALNQAAAMYKARIYDTALDGEYARCVTITYHLQDGTQLLAESMRPTGAVKLLRQQDYTLDASALYTMGGLNAARMQNDRQVCVFAQSDTAVYAITCPVSHAEELANLLRYTTLVAPAAGS